MDQKNNNQHGFGNGFVLGLLVGIVATLLFTTKKGREIFRELTEKGLDRFSDLEDKLQETKSQFAQMKDEYEELEDESDYVPQTPVKLAEEHAEKKQTAHQKHHEHNEHHERPHPTRRFFKSKKN